MSFKNFARRTRVLYSLTLCAGMSFAATKPLNNPQGLALDAKGNLYVANSAANQILIYNPSYAQLTAKTISKNVTDPVGLAIDLSGNIWVANLGGGLNATGSITEYSPAGVQNTSNTITVGVDYPYAIAFDALGDLWVENNFNMVNVYPAYGANPPAPIKSLPATTAVTGVAAHNMWIAFGGNTFTGIEEIATSLVGSFPASYSISSSAYSVAWDAAGNLYVGTIGDDLIVAKAGTTIPLGLVKLGYFPWAIAVDSARGRLYVADASHNQINVYNSTTGALLHTIQ